MKAGAARQPHATTERIAPRHRRLLISGPTATTTTSAARTPAARTAAAAVATRTRSTRFASAHGRGLPRELLRACLQLLGIALAPQPGNQSTRS